MLHAAPGHGGEPLSVVDHLVVDGRVAHEAPVPVRVVLVGEAHVALEVLALELVLRLLEGLLADGVLVRHRGPLEKKLEHFFLS